MGNDGSTPATPATPEQSQETSHVGVTFPESAGSAMSAGTFASRPAGAPSAFAAAATAAAAISTADPAQPALVGLTPAAAAAGPATEATAPTGASGASADAASPATTPASPPPLAACAAPLPVQPIPAQPVAGQSTPPPLPAWLAPQATPISMPAILPVRPYGYPPPPLPQPRSTWGRWGLPLFAAWFMLLLAIGGLALYKSSRHGAPRRASASTSSFRPVYPGTAAARNNTAAKPGARPADPFADPASALKPLQTPSAPPQRPAKPLAVALPLSSLPRDREMDRELKRVWEACEKSELRVLNVKTLRATRSGAVTIQPVRVSLDGTYEDLAKLTRQMHQSFPHVAIETLEIAQPKGGGAAAAAAAGDAPMRVPAELSLVWRLRSDAPANGSEGYDDAPPIPQPDLAPALGMLGAAATDRVMFTTVSIQAPGRGKPGLQGRVGGIATNDGEVAKFLQQLNGSKSLTEVNLVTVDASAYGSQPVRKFAMTFHPAAEGEDISVTGGSTANAGEPFRPTTALKSSAGAPAGGQARVTPNAQLPTEARTTAAKAAQHLHLQAVMSGNGTRSCMINNHMVREGDSISGFVVESIGDSSAVVRQGKFRFELTVAK